MFDFENLLQDNGIDYSTSGKNVTKGWIEINCPYCPDPSKHMGINISKANFHCWQCGKKGALPTLLKDILNIGYYQAKELIKKYEVFGLDSSSEPIKHIVSDLLEPFSKEIYQPHYNYLKRRGFEPEYIQQKYFIRSCWQTGAFSYRVIIPIIEDGLVVNFTGRAISKLQSPKYLHCPNEKSIIPMKECLYNIDSVKDKIIICEGPTDVWRLGDSAVATMGTEFTQAQIKLIHDKYVKQAFVLFDSDAYAHAERLANLLSSFTKVEILELTISNDPAELSEEEVNQIRKELRI